MDLVQVLHDGQGLLGGIGVLLVGVPLQLGQVIGRGGRGLFPGLFYLHQRPHATCQGGGKALRFLPVKSAGLALGVPPGGGEAVKPRLHRPEVTGLEGADLLLPVHDKGQGGGLHPPGGELGVVLAGERPGDVEAHHPVGHTPRPGGAEKVVVRFGGTQVGKALPNGPVGLGGNPQPFGRALPPRLLHNPPGHQLSLPAGVGGDNQIGHVPPAHQGLHRPELPPGLGDNHRFHLFRQHGQGKHVPLGPRLVVVLRGCQLHQVAQSPGDDILLPLQAALSRFPASQHPGQFPAHRRFFRQNQCFCHKTSPNRRKPAFLPQSGGLTISQRFGMIHAEGAPASADWKGVPYVWICRFAD